MKKIKKGPRQLQLTLSQCPIVLLILNPLLLPVVTQVGAGTILGIVIIEAVGRTIFLHQEAGAVAW